MLLSEDRHALLRDEFQLEDDCVCNFMMRPRVDGWPPRTWPDPKPEPGEMPPGPPPVVTGPPPDGSNAPAQDLTELLQRTQAVLDRLDQMPTINPQLKNMILERLIRDIISALVPPQEPSWPTPPPGIHPVPMPNVTIPTGPYGTAISG